MAALADMEKSELETLKATLDEEYASIKAQGLSLNMARGKPSSAQLDLSMPLLDVLNSTTGCASEAGTDCRNYGVIDGIPEAKRLMASMLDDNPENVIVFGSSSLSIMYDTLARLWTFGALGATPWGKLDTVKWLCPVPGYDRHFGVTEAFGIEMINVPMTPAGPDMNVVERLVAADASIKGMWCVPKYSNPDGTTYSDEVVERLAFMKCAAQDFRIFWDNAYCIHHLYDEDARQDHLLDIAAACRKTGTQDRYFKFASTSKVTFPGAGVAAMAASPANIAEIKRLMSAQIIGYDKLNQLRHARFLKDADGLAAHMSKHAALIRPKFECVLNMLDEGLADAGCSWSRPRGGYFICFRGPAGTAKRIVALAKEAGVTMTAAGAPFPYGNDPEDSVIRIAPTLPPLEELQEAMRVFVCCARFACVERILIRR